LSQKATTIQDTHRLARARCTSRRAGRVRADRGHPPHVVPARL